MALIGETDQPLLMRGGGTALLPQLGLADEKPMALPETHNEVQS